MSRILTTSVAGLALMWSATAAAKDRPISDHTQSVTIAPLKATNPFLLAEYEKSLSDKTSFTAGAGYGNFNSLWLRIQNAGASTVGASVTIGQVGVTGAYNYYFKHFNRGWYTGGGLEYDLYTLTYEGGGQSASPGSYSNVTVGPHIGYKIAGEGGFTFSWDYGIGYQLTFGSDDAQAALAISAPSIADSRVASMGSLNMGWSF